MRIILSSFGYSLKLKFIFLLPVFSIFIWYVLFVIFKFQVFWIQSNNNQALGLL